MSNRLYAGVDLGGTHTRLCLYDAENKAFRVSDKRKTAEVIAAGASGEALARTLGEWIASTEYRPCGLAIGLPATLDAKRETIISCPNVPALNGIPIVSQLGQMLELPVIAERDVNFQFFHDLKALGRTCSVGLGFYIGTGIGNAAWINGFYTGAHGASAELGHTPVHGVETPCVCGNPGCLETICSGRWLAEWQRRTVPDTPISEVFIRHADHDDLKAFVVTAAEAMATAINLFDPELVFLGGGIVDMPAFPADKLKTEILRRTRRPFPHDALEIRFASNLSDSGARGACFYAAEHMWKEDK